MNKFIFSILFSSTILPLWGCTGPRLVPSEPDSTASASQVTQSRSTVRILSNQIFTYIKLHRCLPDHKNQEIPQKIAESIRRVDLQGPLDSEAIADLNSSLPNTKELHLVASTVSPGIRKEPKLTLPPHIKELVADMSHFNAQGNVNAVIGNLAPGQRNLSSFVLDLKAQDSPATVLEASDEFPNLDQITIKVGKVNSREELLNFVKSFRETEVSIALKYPQLKKYRLEIYKSTHDIYVENHHKTNGAFKKDTFGNIDDFSW